MDKLAISGTPLTVPPETNHSRSVSIFCSDDGSCYANQKNNDLLKIKNKSFDDAAANRNNTNGPFYGKNNRINAMDGRVTLDRKGLTSMPLFDDDERIHLLFLQNNLIRKLEVHSLSSLKDVVFLDLYNNQLECIAALECMSNLKVLLLGKNRIAEIKGMENLNNLEVLDLHGNKITKISGLKNQKFLRVLNVAANSLTSIQPEDLNGLCNLEEFNLRRNNIRSVSGFENSSNLLKLYLNNNDIPSMENISDLQHLKKLREITLEKNPLTLFEEYSLQLISVLPSLRFIGQVEINEKLKKASRMWKLRKDFSQEADCLRITKDVGNDITIRRSNIRKRSKSENWIEEYDNKYAVGKISSALLEIDKIAHNSKYNLFTQQRKSTESSSNVDENSSKSDENYFLNPGGNVSKSNENALKSEGTALKSKQSISKPGASYLKLRKNAFKSGGNSLRLAESSSKSGGNSLKLYESEENIFKLPPIIKPPIKLRRNTTLQFRSRDSFEHEDISKNPSEGTSFNFENYFSTPEVISSDCCDFANGEDDVGGNDVCCPVFAIPNPETQVEIDSLTQKCEITEKPALNIEANVLKEEIVVIKKSLIIKSNKKSKINGGRIASRDPEYQDCVSGNGYLLEIVGTHLHVIGKNSAKFVDRNWDPSKANEVTTVKFSCVCISSLVSIMARFKMRFKNAKNFIFAENNNFALIGQVNILTEVQGVNSITILPTGNAITDKDWHTYAVYRLTHWGLAYVDNIAVTEDMVKRANETYQGLSDLIVHSLPEELLTPLLEKLNVQMSSPTRNAKQWLTSAEPTLREVICKEALQWRPHSALSPKEMELREKGRVSLKQSIQFAYTATQKINLLESKWDEILRKIISNSVAKYYRMEQ